MARYLIVLTAGLLRQRADVALLQRRLKLIGGVRAEQIAAMRGLEVADIL